MEGGREGGSGGKGRCQSLSFMTRDVLIWCYFFPQASVLESRMLRRRKTTLVPDSSLERTPSFLARSRRKVAVLTHEMLLEAASEVRPSVSEAERIKYSKM